MACYYCDRSPCVCTPSMFDDVPRPLPSEMAIRADERAKVEAETVAKIVALVDQITSFEVNACTHHAESLKTTHSKDRVPLHRMHECAAKQSLALGSIIKGAILSGDWKPSTSGGG